MKKQILVIILLVLPFAGMAQIQNLSSSKKKSVLSIRDTTFFPIRGTFRISESGFGLYKTIEFWVFDAKENQIYYVAQGIPTSEAFADIVNKMIDREYTEFMMRHGKVLAAKSN